MQDLRDAAEQAARDACETADRIVHLVAETQAIGSSSELADSAVDRAVRALVEVGEALNAAELTARRLAQLGLWVSALTLGGDRIERLDRAAVAVLHPPPGAGQTVRLADDPIRLFSRTFAEFETEVGGFLCRLLVDRRAWVSFGPAAGYIAFEVDERDALVGLVELADTSTGIDDALSQLGWSITPGGGGLSWASPVQVSTPARLAIATLRGPLDVQSVRTLPVAAGLGKPPSGDRGAAVQENGYLDVGADSEVPLAPGPEMTTWQVTNGALAALATTKEWRDFARVAPKGFRTPFDLYGETSRFRPLVGRTFESPDELWIELADNMGGGVPAALLHRLSSLSASPFPVEPDDLAPAAVEVITADGLTIPLISCRPQFRRWEGEWNFGKHNRKPVVESDTGPTYPELHIASILAKGDWDAVWVDNWLTRPEERFRRTLPVGEGPASSTYSGNTISQVPAATLELCERIRQRAASPAVKATSWGGCWDVLAWKTNDPSVVLFAESKGPGDNVRPAQVRWAYAAMTEGIPADRLLLVAWRPLGLDVSRRRRARKSQPMEPE